MKRRKYKIIIKISSRQKRENNSKKDNKIDKDKNRYYKITREKQS
jgi:hypothetical protein